MLRKALFLTILLPFAARGGEVLLDEIKTNLDDAQKKVTQARKQISEPEENDSKLKKNLEAVEKVLNNDHWIYRKKNLTQIGPIFLIKKMIVFDGNIAIHDD
mgnify:CR=1 FL=1